MITNKLNLKILKLIKVNHVLLANLYNRHNWQHYYIGNSKSISLTNNNEKILNRHFAKPKFLLLIRHFSNKEDIHGNTCYLIFTIKKFLIYNIYFV